MRIMLNARAMWRGLLVILSGQVTPNTSKWEYTESSALFCVRTSPPPKLEQRSNRKAV